MRFLTFLVYHIAIIFRGVMEFEFKFEYCCNPTIFHIRSRRMNTVNVVGGNWIWFCIKKCELFWVRRLQNSTKKCDIVVMSSNVTDYRQLNWTNRYTVTTNRNYKVIMLKFENSLLDTEIVNQQHKPETRRRSGRCARSTRDTRHDVSPLSLKHCLGIRLNVKAIHLVWLKHLQTVCWCCFTL